MAERPMLMSAPMVRAILDGMKTQTRRVVKGAALEWLDDAGFVPSFAADPANSLCPYGQPGDRLWVREAWAPHPQDTGTVFYRATVEAEPGFPVWDGPWRPSIHMPRWASRITLEITGVRVERLRDISDEDLDREGLQEVIDAGVDHDGTPRDAWRALWSAINGPESWAANPWVWVVEFRRITQ